MSNESKTKLEVFIDHSTLPVINFFMHFSETYQEINTIRLFGLQRYSVPQAVQNQYPEGKIQSCFISMDDYSQIHQLFDKTVAENNNIELTVFLNISHSLRPFIPLWNTYCANRNKFLSIKLELYDEGSLGVYDLYKLSQRDIDLTHLNTKKITNIVDLFDAENRYITDYLWGNILPTTYHLLDTSYLENNPKLSPLRNAIPHYKKIDFSRYVQLNNEQKSLFLTLFGLAPEFVNHLIETFNQNKTFLFIGTVIFDDDQTLLMVNSHLQLMRQYLSKSGKYYLGSDDYKVIYKSHPAARLDNVIQKVYPNVEFIPSSIPVELLYMLGLLPDKIGGFASSCYFSIPHSHIRNVTFITHRDENERKKLTYYRDQYTLREVFIELGLVTESQAHFYNE